MPEALKPREQGGGGGGVDKVTVSRNIIKSELFHPVEKAELLLLLVEQMHTVIWGERT